MKIATTAESTATGCLTISLAIVVSACLRHARLVKDRLYQFPALLLIVKVKGLAHQFAEELNAYITEHTQADPQHTIRIHVAAESPQQHDRRHQHGCQHE